MAGSVNKVILERYVCGESISDLSTDTGIPRSTIRFALKREGLLRSRTDGVRRAAQQGKLGRPGPRGPWPDEVRQRMSDAANLRWAGKAAGISRKASGYIQITQGEHKHRAVHVVLMESRLGRRLLPDEHVHHIDGDRSNNDINNLALVTRSGHARLHRREDKLSGKIRERDTNGRLC